MKSFNTLKKILAITVFATAAVSFSGFDAANASRGQVLQAEKSDWANGISTVEKVQLLQDKQIGSVKVASLNAGSAANPVVVLVMLESPDQEGDGLNYDVYNLNAGFSDDVTATLVGDYLVIKGSRMPVDADYGNGQPKPTPVTLTVQVKAGGKRLASPVVF